MQAQGASDAGRLVSESAYEYLLSEVLAMNPPLRPDLAGHATDEASASAMMAERLDAMGYDVGYRYVEKAVAHQYFIGTEPLDIVKFICKEFWEDIFRKKIDKLQTNHKGVFVLSDNKFKWLERYASDDMASKQAAARLLHFPCGILRGALANLGIASIVNADFNNLPGVTFNIRVRSI